MPQRQERDRPPKTRKTLVTENLRELKTNWKYGKEKAINKFLV